MNSVCTLGLWVKDHSHIDPVKEKGFILSTIQEDKGRVGQTLIREVVFLWPCSRPPAWFEVKRCHSDHKLHKIIFHAKWVDINFPSGHAKGAEETLWKQLQSLWGTQDKLGWYGTWRGSGSCLWGKWLHSAGIRWWPHADKIMAHTEGASESVSERASCLIFKVTCLHQRWTSAPWLF